MRDLYTLNLMYVLEAKYKHELIKLTITIIVLINSLYS